MATQESVGQKFHSEDIRDVLAALVRSGGRATGQSLQPGGLAQIGVARIGGKRGQGTRFTIRLPSSGASQLMAVQAARMQSATSEKAA